MTAGTAFGSLVVASLIWTVLSVPLRRWSVVAWLSQRISNPIVSGVILLIISTQLATIVLPSYFGWRDWLQAENVESRAPASATTGP